MGDFSLWREACLVNRGEILNHALGNGSELRGLGLCLFRSDDCFESLSKCVQTVS